MSHVLAAGARLRNSFSLALTVRANHGDFSVRASKDNGNKAGEDIMLVGALLQTTDGDIKLDTGTLTVADLKNADQCRKLGGLIGMSGGVLNSIASSY